MILYFNNKFNIFLNRIKKYKFNFYFFLKFYKKFNHYVNSCLALKLFTKLKIYSNLKIPFFSINMESRFN